MDNNNNKHLALVDKHLALVDKHLALMDKHIALVDKHIINIVKDIPMKIPLTEGAENEEVRIWERNTERRLNDHSMPLRQKYSLIITDLAFLCNQQPAVYEKIYNMHKKLIEWIKQERI